jgi:hypothetical protein
MMSEQRSSTEARGNVAGYRFPAQLPLNDIPTGLYVVHVEARSNIGERRTVSRDIQIHVH